MKPQVVLCDIDGTVADMGKGVTGRRGPFDWARVGEDDPHQPIIDLVKLLALHHPVYFVSGRDGSCRNETMAWLIKHGLLDEGFGHRLFMRVAKDNRPDHVVKREIYEREIAPYFTVKWVLDDRNAVVREWRAMCLTVLQVAEGDF